jgi:deoxyadenosine/deoxycytidine kinase
MAEEEGGEAESGPLVGVVGPCGAGKSLLVAALKRQEIRAQEIAQEHSYVPDMWRRITDPDLLVYLDVSREVAEERQGNPLRIVMWEQMVTRLAHAREHADVIVPTDHLAPDEVVSEIKGSLAGLLTGHRG